MKEYSFVATTDTFIGFQRIKKGDKLTWGGSNGEGSSSVTFAFYINDKERVENPRNLLKDYLSKTKNRVSASKILNKK